MDSFLKSPSSWPYLRGSFLFFSRSRAFCIKPSKALANGPNDFTLVLSRDLQAIFKSAQNDGSIEYKYNII